jgi:hypothetical protein
MMDLKEATASIDFYTFRLDLGCAQYRLGVEANGMFETSVTEDHKDSAIADLKRLQREVLILLVLIEQASGTEADRLLCMPEDFLKLRNAKERNALAFNRATELLCEHQKKAAEEAEKRREALEPSTISATQIAIDEFKRRRAEELRAELEKRFKARAASTPKTPGQLEIEEFNRQKAAKNAVALNPSEDFKRKYPGRNIRTQDEI